MASNIPVTVPPVTGKGSKELFTITAGKGRLAETMEVSTGGKDLRVTVRSGKNTFSVPVDKKDWLLTIEIDLEK